MAAGPGMGASGNGGGRWDQGFKIRPVTGNRRPPVPVYRSGLAGYRSELDKFKFKFKLPSSTGSYRYTGRFDRYTGQFGW